MKKKGLLITLEGPEGCGKTTQVANIAAYCNSLGVQHIVLREPGATVIGEAIRELLLHLSVKNMAPETELMLYLAARAQIVHEKILPALRAGRVVICDRFEDSTLAYQGFGRGLPVVEILKASKLVRKNLQPNVTFLLDLDPRIAFKRIGRRDRMERAPLAFHRRVREGFLTLARKQKQRFRVIDAAKTPDEVFCGIRKVLERVLL